VRAKRHTLLSVSLINTLVPFNLKKTGDTGARAGMSMGSVAIVIGFPTSYPNGKNRNH